MATEKDIVALYDLRVSVEPTGILTQLLKFPTKFTGKNYIPVRLTDKMEEDKFNFGLSSRVKADEIMVLRTPYFGDRDSHVDRQIYFLEGQFEEAKTKVRTEIDTILTRMKANTEKMHEAWVKRIDRPRRKD